MSKRRVQSDIFEYSDYRQYLADYYSNKKMTNPNYSHRVFARQAGLSSPSHLLMIIKGSRNLSLKTIPKFAEGLKLNAKQKKYFELLVHYNQTDDLPMKAKFFSEIMNLKGSLKALHDLEKEKFEFLSKWYMVAIYVLIDLKDFRADPAWIAKRLSNHITPAQADDAIKHLEKLGLIEPDPHHGFRQLQGAVTVADDTRSMAVFNYHESMIRLASESLRKSRQEEREMNGVTIAVPLNRLPEIKEKIRAFRKEINRLASSYENADEVYQLNVQFFPLTKSEKQ
ncbi:MAG: TIGR02147 family protein [Bdellovibrionales bacterium]|nr:TIGR02147 family protein [Bdellovibrionales bacterium]